MNVEMAAVGRLLATSAVTALVGTRVRQLKLKDSEVLPAVRVQIISERFASHLRGTTNARRGRLQVDVYANASQPPNPYRTANAVADAVFSALTGEPWTVADSPTTLKVLAVPDGDRRVTYEPDELDQIRVIQEFSIVSKRMA